MAAPRRVPASGCGAASIHPSFRLSCWNVRLEGRPCRGRSTRQCTATWPRPDARPSNFIPWMCGARAELRARRRRPQRPLGCRECFRCRRRATRVVRRRAGLRPPAGRRWLGAGNGRAGAPVGWALWPQVAGSQQPHRGAGKRRTHSCPLCPSGIDRARGSGDGDAGAASEFVPQERCGDLPSGADRRGSGTAQVGTPRRGKITVCTIHQPPSSAKMPQSPSIAFPSPSRHADSTALDSEARRKIQPFCAPRRAAADSPPGSGSRRTGTAQRGLAVGGAASATGARRDAACAVAP
jgi:hypothetical protein